MTNYKPKRDKEKKNGPESTVQLEALKAIKLEGPSELEPDALKSVEVYNNITKELSSSTERFLFSWSDIADNNYQRLRENLKKGIDWVEKAIIEQTDDKTIIISDEVIRWSPPELMIRHGQQVNPLNACINFDFV